MTRAPGTAPAPHRIVDAQVNLASLLAIPRAFIEHQAANVHHRLDAYGVGGRPSRVRNQVFSLYEDDDADQLVAEMDEAGVDQAFLVAPDYSHVADCALTQSELAALHDRVNRRHPGRLHVFWGVDPRGGQDGIDLFERCVTEYGFAGMKLYPPCGYSPSDPRLNPYFERCAHYGIPVLIHTGPGWGPLDFTFGSPLLVDRAARDFPASPSCRVATSALMQPVRSRAAMAPASCSAMTARASLANSLRLSAATRRHGRGTAM